jgi:hypothetical protein
MVEMAEHHPVEQPFLGERPVGLDLDLAPGVRDIGEHLVAVGAARSMPRKMLRHGGDSCRAMGADEGGGKRGDGVGVGSEASVPLHDDVVVGIEAEIDHWAEIEVETRLGQLLGHRPVEALGRLRRGEARVGAYTPGRRKVAMTGPPGQPLHQSPFLIDGNERDRPRLGIAQIGDERAEFLRRPDIVRVEHDAADRAHRQLIVYGHDVGLMLAPALEAGHDHLPDHGVEPRFRLARLRRLRIARRAETGERHAKASKAGGKQHPHRSCIDHACSAALALARLIACRWRRCETQGLAIV